MLKETTFAMLPIGAEFKFGPSFFTTARKVSQTEAVMLTQGRNGKTRVQRNSRMTLDVARIVYVESVD